MQKPQEIELQETCVVCSHDVLLDNDYVSWISEIKHRYRATQVKASVKVNAEKLLFNWELGRDLVQKKAEERWGAGVVEQVSLDLKREFPDAEGFSAPNLWFMKKWYLFYTSSDEVIKKLYQLGGELNGSKLYQVGREMNNVNLQPIAAEKNNQSSADFPSAFAFVPSERIFVKEKN